MKLIAAALLIAGHSPQLRAQAVELTAHPELRVDAILAQHRSTMQGGLGVEIPAGYYTRIGVVGAAGADVASGSPTASGRVDVTARFLFDPFRQQRWALSAGGGVSLLARDGDRVRPVLVALVDVEGPRSASGISPAMQLGLGGGVRIGVALRRAAERAR